MKRYSAQDYLTGVLVLLFTYAALSKALDAQQFSRQMLNQVFAPWFNHLLVFAIPGSEAAAVALMLTERTRYAGLLVSAALMACFSGYTGLVLAHVFKRVPCSCGGILGKLKWGPHFAFNLFFLAAAVIAICLEQRERRYRRFQML